jgi:hypothetical protein
MAQILAVKQDGIDTFQRRLLIRYSNAQQNILYWPDDSRGDDFTSTECLRDGGTDIVANGYFVVGSGSGR